MTSSDFGYKFLDKELRRIRQAGQAPSVGAQQPRPLVPSRQGPQQLQRRFALSPEAYASMQYFDDIDFITSSMLPQVYEALGQQGRDDVVNEIRGRRRAELRRARREEPRIDYSNLLNPRETQLPSYNEPIVGGFQPLIPGLRTQIDDSNKNIRELQAADQVQQFNDFLEKYPELFDLYSNPVENYGVTATRIDPKSFEKYKQYTDLEQKYSDPELRADLYNNVLEDTMNKIDLGDGEFQKVRNNLVEAESLYASGDPELQKQGRDLMRDFGIDIESIERPAFQQKRPIIGGGGYTTPETSEDVKYINQRAADELAVLSKMGDEAMSYLAKLLPGLRRGEFYGDTERTFFSPTDYIEEVDPYEEEGYQVKVDRPSPTTRLVNFDPEYFPPNRKISKNVVRFLKDNPGYIPQSVSFKVGSPGTEGILGHGVVEDVPEEIKRPLMRFVQDASMRNQRAGTILTNRPLDNDDLINKARIEGLDETTSSYLRALAPFEKANVDGPTIRGKAYALAGYGPVSRIGDQYTYIDRQGKAVPIQLQRPERPLVGRIMFTDEEALSRPAASYESQPRFYSTVVPGLTPEAVARFAGDIRRTPSALLPGVADLIPSAEAVRRGYQEGPGALAQQVGTDFVAGIPVSAALAPILSSPALAPFAPGVGAGLVGSAGLEALNEAVKQQTGKSLLTRSQETAGTIGGDTRYVGTPRQPGEQNLTPDQRLQREQDLIDNPPEIRQGIPLTKQKAENFLERRLRLAQEARQRDSGDLGITELILGR